MSEEEKKVEEETRTLTLKVTLPTKETVVKAITSMFPGIEVTVEPEKKKDSVEEI